LALIALALFDDRGFAQITTRHPSAGFDTSYGNSHFGAWINDEFGLPAFRYDGCSVSTCSEPTNAFHQLGNGQVAARAFTDGYVELFTAKTYYRFANRYDGQAKNFAGGFGWVRDGDTVWSTLYADRPDGSTYGRQFGMGYYKKSIVYHDLRVEHYIYAAPGGEEALLERIVFTNLSGAAKSIRYIDYWDVAWWLVFCDDKTPDALVCSPKSGYDPARVRTSYDSQRRTLKLRSEAPAGDLNLPSLTADPSPKTAFVAFLNDTPDHCDTVQDAFFGGGDRKLPDHVRSPDGFGTCVDTPGTQANQAAVLATEKRWEIAPGASQELHVLYGIAPRDSENSVIDRYRGDPTYRLPAIMDDWALRIPSIDLPDNRWIAREMAWSTYYLLSGMLREDFFDTRVINQGSIYQYIWGANAGPRAALRHALPLIYLEPQAARDVITYYFRAMKNTGELAYATAGYGAWKPMGFSPSDSGLWLLWAAAEYVNATRDFAFLEAEHDYYCENGRGGCGRATGYAMLKKAYEYQRDVVSIGSHKLVSLKNADWDDSLVKLSPLSLCDPKITIETGESTLNTVLAVLAYPMFAAIAERRGDTEYANLVRQNSVALTNALGAQWRDSFLNRAYLCAVFSVPVEVGNTNLWLAANGIGLLDASLFTTPQAKLLVDRLRTDLLAPSPLGLASQGSPVSGKGSAGFWYSLAGPALEGLTRRTDIPAARDVAWDAFRRQTLATHAQYYPDVWYGVWSGPDMYYTPLDANPREDTGKTWCLKDLFGQPLPQLCMLDVPVTNMFAHSEPLIGSVRMAGLWADGRGLTIDPAFPQNYTTFAWKSRVFSVVRTQKEIRGHVTAGGNDILEMRVCVRQISSPDALTVTVNGQPATFTFDAATSFVQFRLPVMRDVEAKWSVQIGG
jgi:hypothetical protein